MDSPASAARGRGRASARKRHALPAGPSSHLGSSTITTVEQVDQQLPSSTPADSLASSSFSFGTPSPTASRGTRARARVADGTMPSSDDLDNKGGRSLRKRARVDYTFDQGTEEYLSDNSKSTPSAARAIKRRRTDTAFHDFDKEEDFNTAHIKRRSSEQLLPPASSLRRRNQLRKSTGEHQALIPDQHMEDVEVQDTIEVGGHQSEQSDESTLRRTTSNTSSSVSNDDSKPSHVTTSSDIVSTPRKSRLGLAQVDFDHEDAVKHHEAPDTRRPGHSNSVVDESLHPSYAHLTPYINGAFIEWPPAQAEAEPASELPPLQQDVLDDAVDDQLDGAQADNIKADIALEDTPMTDPLVPDSTPVDGAMDDTPAMSPLPTRANSPTADIDLPYSQPPVRGPIAFKKARDASEFIDLLEDFKSLPPEEVWARLEVVNRALAAWQDEYNELRKITDDEDNAVRYRTDDAAFEHRVKMLTSKDPDANPVQKDFIIRGIRADRPHPEIAYARHQDKLMATNYYFDYDDRDAKIGFQDPLEQKPGSGKGRLRDRPKQTAKAAEADDGVVVHGKRVRKPPALFDGSEAASRGSTPIPTQRRRRRAGDVVEENSEANPKVPASATAPIEPQPLKKKGKGGRPRKHPLPVPVPEAPEATPVPAEQVQQQPEKVEKVDEEKPTRKRRRRRTIVEAGEEEEALTTNGVDQRTPVKAELRRTNSRLSEVPSGSFYTSSMQSNNTADESRPPTSSSTATQSTITSNNYQLREKRQKKFSLNPEDEPREEEPKRKRVRRSKKTQVEDFAATPVPVPIPSPMPTQQPAPETHPTTKPPTKIKIKNYNGSASAPHPMPIPPPNPFSVPSSSSSTPPHSGSSTSNAAAAYGTDPADIKDYNQMTKSEKMSHSMKARWASGSMSQAVAKRRATLANKKQAVKAAEPGQQPEPTPVMTQS
ncbi:hypothetical protein F5B22DRAFT_638307 [Xylaria bambusicola]|uniref:uncharacterized protein n=1 Tax=Xylaria bambusicola TaxID=326684 RepID=UPI0020081735|nr:uncharacterized protein F5B22DRAFT_638307 [Xylaria bambusicola]KAI0509131.1 hypothetical protein F5B22DRAFT_638307 [Xylaria bambusicola]